jgi:hypothetical protein
MGPGTPRSPLWCPYILSGEPPRVSHIAGQVLVQATRWRLTLAGGAGGRKGRGISCILVFIPVLCMERREKKGPTARSTRGAFPRARLVR